MAQQKAKEKTGEKAPINRPSMLSQERIVDSDSEDSGEDERVPDTPLPKATPPVKKAAAKPSTSLIRTKRKESPSSFGEEAANDEDGATEDETSEEPSEKESESTSSDATNRPATQAQPTSQLARKRRKPSIPNTIAPKPFKAPHGFERTKVSTSDYAAESIEFLHSDLSTKQIWHITAPASVNIRDIKPFDIQDVRSGKPIFNKNGIDYGFSAGLHTTERLLLPEGEAVEYVQAGSTISGTYHLREIGRSKYKKDAEGKQQQQRDLSFAANSLVMPKPPREQPHGLRMRYQPYGSVTASKVATKSIPAATFSMVPELPESQLDKSVRKKAKREKKASQQAKETSQDVDAMDLDPIPTSDFKNPESGKPTETATQMVDKVFEAATETQSQETKRKKKKKKNRISEEIPT